MADTRIVAGTTKSRSKRSRDADADDGQHLVPAYKLEVHTIYANASGSDATGNGSVNRPFRTFQKAIRAVPSIIPSGRIYTVDVTGLGEEMFPPGYQMPVILSPGLQVFAAGIPPEDPNALPFANTLPLNIKAVPMAAVTSPPAPADMTLLAADYTSSADPNTGLITLTLTGAPRASWASSALKGKFLISADSTANSAIYDSSTTQLFLCHTAPVAEDVNIVEPSATFRTPTVNPDALIEEGGGFECMTTSTVAFQGIKFTCDDPNPAASALGLFGQLAPILELCDIGGLDTAGGLTALGCTNCVIRDKAFITVPASNFVIGSLLLNLVNFSIAGSNANFFVSSVFDTCTTFSSNAGLFTPLGSMLSLSWEVASCLFKNSTGIDAAILTRGDAWAIVNTQIDNSAGDAIRVQGGLVNLSGVTGSGNAGIGINANNGAQVAATSVSVTGSSPGSNDVQSGALPAVGYPALAAQQQIDIPPLGSITNCTLTRIYIP